jgi:hypothetical protein
VAQASPDVIASGRAASATAFASNRRFSAASPAATLLTKACVMTSFKCSGLEHHMGFGLLGISLFGQADQNAAGLT